MTKKEKEALIYYLEEIVADVPVCGDSNDESSRLWYVEDVKAAILDLTEDFTDNNKINTEEYVRVCNKWTQTSEELHDTKQKLKAAETELNKLRTAISALEFAYGRKLCI